MLLREIMEETNKAFRVQMYATDLEVDVIVQARGASRATVPELRGFFSVWQRTQWNILCSSSKAYRRGKWAMSVRGPEPDGGVIEYTDLRLATFLIAACALFSVATGLNYLKTSVPMACVFTLGGCTATASVLSCTRGRPACAIFLHHDAFHRFNALHHATNGRFLVWQCALPTAKSSGSVSASAG